MVGREEGREEKRQRDRETEEECENMKKWKPKKNLKQKIPVIKRKSEKHPRIDDVDRQTLQKKKAAV